MLPHRLIKPAAGSKLTTVTLAGSMKAEWVNSAAAGTSLSGGREITHRGMCMCIETESLS